MNNTAQNMGTHLSKIGNFMPFLFVFFLYLLVIRPQQKKEKKRQEMIAGLKKGDVVLTSSGIKGVVEKVEEQEIFVSIAKGTSVSFAKNAITCVVGHRKLDQDNSAPHRPTVQHKKKKVSPKNKKGTPRLPKDVS